MLLLHGEELVGAKSDRVLHLILLVPAQGALESPVACVDLDPLQPGGGSQRVRPEGGGAGSPRSPYALTGGAWRHGLEPWSRLTRNGFGLWLWPRDPRDTEDKVMPDDDGELSLYEALELRSAYDRQIRLSAAHQPRGGTPWRFSGRAGRR